MSKPMMAALIVLPLLMAAPAGVEGFVHWPAGDIQAWNGKLAAGMAKDKLNVFGQSLGDWGNHNSSITRRNADGEAEVHEKVVDYFICEGGEATLKVGGKVVKPRNTGPGEIRGAGIEGGVSVVMRPGDVAHIPANTPHQLLVKKEFLYFVIKVKQ
jgi:hypothetical protein